jgi:hypothetical protein
VAAEILRRFGWFATGEVGGSSNKLMPVGEDPARDERGVFELAYPEGQIDSLGDLIDDAFGNEDLDADVGVGCLECTDKGASSESEMLGGAESRKLPETFSR